MKSNTCDTCEHAVVKNDPSSSVKYNDLIILYGGHAHIYLTKLAPGGISHLKYGTFIHEDIVGKEYGTKVYDNNTKKWLAILRPTAEFITSTIPHRTQILYHVDITLILMLLNARPGKNIVETGTGSGSLSTSIARSISPGGQLYTYEIHDDRFEKAKEFFQEFGLSSIVSVMNSDVYTQGFGKSLNNSIDGIFLDLPAPWLTVIHCKSALKEGGYLVNFSPCIEQVQKFYQEVEKFNFSGMKTFEILSKPWATAIKSQDSKTTFNLDTHTSTKKLNTLDAFEHQDRKSSQELYSPSSSINHSHYQLPIRSHTGYVTFCRKCISHY